MFIVGSVPPVHPFAEWFHHLWVTATDLTPAERRVLPVLAVIEG
jgi:hypothetical protein